MVGLLLLCVVPVQISEGGVSCSVCGCVIDRVKAIWEEKVKRYVCENCYFKGSNRLYG